MDWIVYNYSNNRGDNLNKKVWAITIAIISVTVLIGSYLFVINIKRDEVSACPNDISGSMEISEIDERNDTLHFVISELSLEACRDTIYNDIKIDGISELRVYVVEPSNEENYDFLMYENNKYVYYSTIEYGTKWNFSDNDGDGLISIGDEIILHNASKYMGKGYYIHLTPLIESPILKDGRVVAIYWGSCFVFTKIP